MSHCFTMLHCYKIFHSFKMSYYSTQDVLNHFDRKFIQNASQSFYKLFVPNGRNFHEQKVPGAHYELFVFNYGPNQTSLCLFCPFLGITKNLVQNSTTAIPKKQRWCAKYPNPGPRIKLLELWCLTFTFTQKLQCMFQIGILSIVHDHRDRALAWRGPQGPGRPMSGYANMLSHQTKLRPQYFFKTSFESSRATPGNPSQQLLKV